MAVSLEDKLVGLPGDRRAKVDARAAELIAEEMTLRDLRRALDRTQVALAKELGVKQETISRLEKRSDMLLSTLRSYVEAIGGELDLIAKLPDRPPVRLKGVSTLLPQTAHQVDRSERSLRMRDPVSPHGEGKIPERSIEKIEISETEHDRHYWLTRPYFTSHIELTSAQRSGVLVLPWENFRESKHLFPSGTGDFFKHIKTHTTLPITIAIDRSLYQEITLHSNEYRLPTLLISTLVINIVAQVITDYISTYLRADPEASTVELEMYVQPLDHPCLKFRYRGPAGRSVDRIVAEVKRCFPEAEHAHGTKDNVPR